MGMEYVIRSLEEAGENNLAIIVAGVRKEYQAKGYGKDIPSQVAQAKETFSMDPLSPGSVTNFWQSFIRTSVLQAGSEVTREIHPDKIVVPAVDRSAEELEALQKEGRGMVYDPRISYPLLGKIFSGMDSYATGDNSPIQDEHEDTGWFDVEMDVDAPNRNTTEDELRALFAKPGQESRRGMRLSTYIWASQANKALNGKYFDEGDTWSRLLGSREGGSVISACFDPDGDLLVGSVLGSSNPGPRLGGRSEGVKA